MADVDFDDFDGGYGAPNARHSQVSKLINLAGAACSVALVVTLGLWGYKLAVRDVNGIPVVRAMEGPMRIAPENPGGEVRRIRGLPLMQSPRPDHQRRCRSGWSWRPVPLS